MNIFTWEAKLNYIDIYYVICNELKSLIRMYLKLSICTLLIAICNFTDKMVIVQDYHKAVNSDDSDFSFIMNADHFGYWECIYSPTSYEKSRATQKLVARFGNEKFSKYTKKIFSSVGFLTACGPGFCSYYIVAVKKDKTISIINNKVAFKAFLGGIDNLAEAKLAIRNDGYFLPSYGQYSGQYKLLNEGYKFNVFDFDMKAHLSDKAFKPIRISVKIDRLGKVTRL